MGRVKALHEQLKELSEESHPRSHLYSLFKVTNMVVDERRCAILLEKIAEEIERSYIQLPTDKNGELWEIGDNFIYIFYDPGYEDRIKTIRNFELTNKKWWLIDNEGFRFPARECERP